MAKWDLSKLEEAIPDSDYAHRVNKVESLFRYEHLPRHLQEASQPFHDLALFLTDHLPNSAEYTLALRSLWEAKNLAVFAAVEAQEKEVQNV